MSVFRVLKLALIVMAATVSGSFAMDIKAGDLIIRNPVIPATVASAPVAAGYLEISNTGNDADRLVGVSADLSEKAEIHTMKMVEGVMRMRPLADGIEIGPGETVLLKKGGMHLMFMRLQQPMQVGESHRVILVFERAGSVEVGMKVVDPASLGGSGTMDHSHSGHNG